MPSNNLRNLSKRLKSISNRVTKGVEKKVRKVALTLDQVLVISTPVDTSRARSNWVVSIGVPILTDLPPEIDGSLGQRSAAINAAISKALSQGLQAINAWTITIGQDIVISNGVPYIVELDGGSSPQAKNGMVEPAIDAAIAAFNTGSVI